MRRKVYFCIMELKILPKEFYTRDTTIVAKELLGKLFIRIINQNLLSAEIVETEAYLPYDDPACHAAKRKTNRNAAMFEQGGILYVYFIYGNYFCANVVTETQGLGSAVLIRAARPVEGIDMFRKNRNKQKIEELCNGPGKFATAFALTKEQNYYSLLSSDIFISEYKDYSEQDIIKTTRIGIKKGTDLPLRFYVKNSNFISRK